MKYNIYGDEVEKGNQDKEYFENRELIDVDELALSFEQKAKMKLSGYKNIFGKFEKNTTDFFELPMNTSISKEQLRQLTKEFFSRVDNDLYEQVEEVFNVGENADFSSSNIVLEFRDINEEGYACCSRMDFAGTDIPFLDEIKDTTDSEFYEQIMKIAEPRTVIKIDITRKGNISDLYNLVHELTHYFILKEKKENGMLSEVAPQCMERLVDDFLLSLTFDECNKFGINKHKLMEDVLLRNIYTFGSAYKEVKDFNKMHENNKRGAIEQEYLKYILSFIYQSKFVEFTSKQRKEKIIELINGVKNNDFKNVNEVLQIKWEDRLKRQGYIEKPISNVLCFFDLYKATLRASKEKKVNILEDGERQ